MEAGGTLVPYDSSITAKTMAHVITGTTLPTTVASRLLCVANVVSGSEYYVNCRVDCRDVPDKSA
jgi:hypothetical protein